MLDLTGNVEGFLEAIREKRRATLSPPPLVSVDEWADTRRYLGREESRIVGQFDTSAVEVCRGPMRAVTEPGVRKVTVLSSAQLMKTTTILNTLGYLIDYDPCPILLYQPTDKDCADFASDKINPMLRNTPSLTSAFGGKRALTVKSNENQVTKKRFRGGFYTLLHAGSANSFSSRSVRAVLFDEIDKYAALKAGDPIALGEKRTETYEDSRIIIVVSTPRETGTSRIEASYAASDQRKAYVTCPHCGEDDHLRWEDVQWQKDESGRGLPETAHIFCKTCGTGWEEHERHKLLSTKGAISWRQTRPFTCCGKNQRPEETKKWVDNGWVHRAACTECGRLAVSNEHAGFRASALYTTFRSLTAIVKDWLDAQGDRSKLRHFVNEVLAETFEADDQQTHFEAKPEMLATRVEVPWDKVPAGVKYITLGGDNQTGEANGTTDQTRARLECEVVGWGDGDESWSLGYHIIPGDPATSEPCEALDEILLKPFETDDGRTLRIQAACIDAGGHHLASVSDFCGKRTKRRVWMVRGASEAAGTRQRPWPKMHTTAKGGGRLYMIGTQALKDRIADMISAEKPGPLYMHVPADRPESWHLQMTAEKRVIFQSQGRMRTQWKPIRARNEALDCRVYALAALEGSRSIDSRILAGVLPAQTANMINSVPEKVEGITTRPAPKPARRPAKVRGPRQGSIWGR